MAVTDSDVYVITSAYCKKHIGQVRDCEYCPGPDWSVKISANSEIKMHCQCKCHKRGVVLNG